MTHNSSRRQFLTACGALGLSAAVSASLAPVAHASIGKENSFTQTKLQMGTIVSITAIHSSRHAAEEAMGRAFDEIDRLTAIFSRYDSASPVSVLNRDGNVRGVPAELAELMNRALRYGSLSDNAFNIAVKPVLDLYEERRNLEGGLELSRGELNDVLALVDAKGVNLTRNSIEFKRQGMGITLDGIAKGYIVDKASAILAAYGISKHMVNAGGDIRTSGSKADGSPWVIAIEDPYKQRNYPATVAMYTGAIATSGGYEVFYDKARLHSHLVSPERGTSPHSVLSVSVTAPSVMEADALATAVYIMQERQGAQFIDSLPQRECLILSRRGTAYTSRHWGA